VCARARARAHVKPYVSVIELERCPLWIGRELRFKLWLR